MKKKRFIFCSRGLTADIIIGLIVGLLATFFVGQSVFLVVILFLGLIFCFLTNGWFSTIIQAVSFGLGVAIFKVFFN